MIIQGHSKTFASTEKNKNILKFIISACHICVNDIAYFPLPVTKIAWKSTGCALFAGNYIFKPSRRVPWNLFLFVRMNTFVYYHSALLAHFPREDTKIAEELRGAPRESPHNRNFEETVNLIVPQEVLWSIWGSHQTLWSLPLPNVTWHSGTWPYTMTPSIDQTLHLFANLLPNWTLIPILTLLSNFGGFHRTLQRVRLANRGRLLLRTPGPVSFGTCICSNVETILSWACHVYGPFEFRTSLGTSILLTYYIPCYVAHLVITR